MKVPGRASMCLLAACLCELVVVGVGLALLPGLAAESERQEKGGDGVSFYTEFALDKAQTLLYSYAMLGAITLALAALAWRRGGTPGTRAAMTVGLVPYTLLCFFLWLTSVFRADEILERYSHLAAWPAIVVWLLYVAATILLFLSRKDTRGADQMIVYRGWS
ncbi:hypothetical protein ABT352_05340 [Streptosporangium sp. NPDC000563]|uniref:hypothetical protein n=1 Tax=Streptosporangium sp. NPDC000563 TaxID=3154366 RepID=UPI00332BB541